MRNKFDNQLILLNNELILMGSLIEKAISCGVVALFEKDKKMALIAQETEEDINKKEREIESQCLKLLLQQQPVAKDLRIISSALKIITDMERIGDMASDISEIALYLADKHFRKKVDKIKIMAEETIKMVNMCIDAFVKKDLEIAKEVEKYDDIIDNLFTEIKNELITLIRTDIENGEIAIDLIMIAKYFERIGDHAVNIAQWVIFSITGKHTGLEK